VLLRAPHDVRVRGPLFWPTLSLGGGALANEITKYIVRLLRPAPISVNFGDSRQLWKYAPGCALRLEPCHAKSPRIAYSSTSCSSPQAALNVVNGTQP